MLCRAYKFLGKKVSILIMLDSTLGLLWFTTETGFLVIFQGFLLSIGVLGVENLRLPEWYPHSLGANLILLASYGFIRAVLTGLKKMVPSLSSQTFTANQRKKILEKSFFTNHKKPTSEILSVFGELTSKSGHFLFHCSSALSLTVVLLLLMAFSVRLAPIETILSLFTLCCIMLPLKRFNKRIQVFGGKLVIEWDKANKVLVDGLRNIFLLRIYNLLGEEYTNGKSRIEQYESHYVEYLSLSTIISSIPLFLGLLIIAGVTFFSKAYLKTDPLHFLAFLYLFLRIAQNASLLSTALSNTLFYRDAFLKLYRWTSTDSEFIPNFSNVVENKLINPIELKIENLSFSYTHGIHVLQNLSVDINGGDFLLIKGPSGAGKSTIIKLLTGMVKPTTGVISVDGMLPSNFIEKYSHVVGYVGPEPYLMPGSVEDNLLFGNKQTLPPEEIWQVLTSLGLSTVIQEFPNQLNEILHEETQLSTGQKQRLSFARAVLRKPKLLILDEATANIDFKTEQMILDYLKLIKGKTTVVAVSHRESFDGLADKVISIGI
jgi:ABC-type multidrug transport system fused ATPase/permease subunit